MENIQFIASAVMICTIIILVHLLGRKTNEWKNELELRKWLSKLVAADQLDIFVTYPTYRQAQTLGTESSENNKNMNAYFNRTLMPSVHRFFKRACSSIVTIDSLFIFLYVTLDTKDDSKRETSEWIWNRVEEDHDCKKYVHDALEASLKSCGQHFDVYQFNNDYSQIVAVLIAIQKLFEDEIVFNEEDIQACRDTLRVMEDKLVEATFRDSGGEERAISELSKLMDITNLPSHQKMKIAQRGFELAERYVEMEDQGSTCISSVCRPAFEKFKFHLGPVEKKLEKV